LLTSSYTMAPSIAKSITDDTILVFINNTRYDYNIIYFIMQMAT